MPLGLRLNIEVSVIGADCHDKVVKDAFEACQHGIGRMKKMSTIKKQEIFR